MNIFMYIYVYAYIYVFGCVFLYTYLHEINSTIVKTRALHAQSSKNEDGDVVIYCKYNLQYKLKISATVA